MVIKHIHNIQFPNHRSSWLVLRYPTGRKLIPQASTQVWTPEKGCPESSGKWQCYFFRCRDSRHMLLVWQLSHRVLIFLQSHPQAFSWRLTRKITHISFVYFIHIITTCTIRVRTFCGWMQGAIWIFPTKICCYLLHILFL